MAVLGRGQPVPAVISRGSLADPPVLTTQPPKVIPPAATPRWGAPNVAVTGRASLQDFATPVTRPPQVIPAAGTRGWGAPAAPVVSSAPAAPAAAVLPQPLIVARAVKLAAAQPPIILRGSLADAAALATAAPVITAHRGRRPAGFLLICSAPFIAPAPPTVPGTLTAASAPGSTLTAGDGPAGTLTPASGGSQLTAATAAAGCLTAGTQPAGGPS